MVFLLSFFILSFFLLSFSGLTYKKRWIVEYRMKKKGIEKGEKIVRKMKKWEEKSEERENDV